MSILFDDANPDYLTFSSWTAVTGTPWTIAIWMTNDDTANVSTGIGIADLSVDNSRWFIDITGSAATDPVRFTIGDPTSGSQSKDATTGTTVNQWHHLCARSAAANDFAVYVDGGSKDVISGSRTPTGIDTMRIGVRAGASAFSPHSGLLFWSTIWKVALNDFEIAHLGTRGVDPRSVRGPAIVSNVRCDAINSVRDLANGTILAKTGSPTLSYDNPPVARLGVRGRGRLSRVG